MGEGELSAKGRGGEREKLDRTKNGPLDGLIII
jgi:hypothetical protein